MARSAKHTKLKEKNGKVLSPVRMAEYLTDAIWDAVAARRTTLSPAVVFTYTTTSGDKAMHMLAYAPIDKVLRVCVDDKELPAWAVTAKEDPEVQAAAEKAIT